MNLWPLSCWDCGFESRQEHGCLSCVVCQWRTQDFFLGGGFQQIQLKTEDRENVDLGGGSHLVRGSGGSCNLVQEISFHKVKFS